MLKSLFLGKKSLSWASNSLYTPKWMFTLSVAFWAFAYAYKDAYKNLVYIESKFCTLDFHYVLPPNKEHLKGRREDKGPIEKTFMPLRFFKIIPPPSRPICGKNALSFAFQTYPVLGRFCSANQKILLPLCKKLVPFAFEKFHGHNRERKSLNGASF